MIPPLARPSGPVFDRGWLTNRQAKEAHHFDDGHSACHLWTATILDRPAPPNVPRCPTCQELVSRDRS